ncbi:MAG: alpha/beta hydrolase [Pararheinheimera sp.]|nr:alpha/beta hydrolase [Rheinheimera sp.]
MLKTKNLILLCYTAFMLLSQSLKADETPAPSFQVQVEGKGKAIILIPGLMSDQRVWQQLATALKPNYQLHLVSLAGFAGTPALTTPLKLTQVTSELAAYIQHQQLKQPIVIGHSMGAFLAFQLASSYPQLTGKVIAVDGLPYLAPVFSRDSTTTVTQMAPQAKMMQQFYQQMTAVQLAESAQQGMAIQVSQQEHAAIITKMAGTSDPATVGAVIAELLTTDLRSEVHKIQQPVLLLGAGGALPSAAMRPAVQALYQQQINTIPQAKLDFNWQARHFIMWDQPDWLLAQITDFIKE